MADEADIAGARMEWEDTLRARQTKPVGLPLTGFCHNCEQPVADTHAFCDEFCRDDFSKQQRMLQISGRK